MKCDKCNSNIADGDERDHKGQILCEDCYMDALSTVKTCDPWAVYAAKSMSDNSIALSSLQSDILAAIKKAPTGIEPEHLAEKVGLSPDDLQREIATLRHMEKVRAAIVDDKKVICLW